MKAAGRIALIAGLLLFPIMTFAHRLDEYLQATRLDVAPDRVVVKMDLTPGVEVAHWVFAQINTDRDRRISESEGKTYANQVLNQTVLELDGRRLHLSLVSSQFPTFQEMTSGTGVVRIEARAAWEGRPGRHLLFFQNNHQPAWGAYLVNALIPSNRAIEITNQQRDSHQREIHLEFNIRNAVSPDKPHE